VPPEKILVYRSALGIVQEIPSFKDYVKDVLAPEWPAGSNSAAYEAGALAVKMYGWYFVVNWSVEQRMTPGGICYHVDDSQQDQAYVPGSSTFATGFAVEQTWNWLLQSGGLIYPTFYRAGCGPPSEDPLCPYQTQTDACGQVNLVQGDGLLMSQNGSKTCSGSPSYYSWAQIISTYYRPNAYPNVNLTGVHTYGQWHAATAWGPAPYWPLSVSGNTWKFKYLNTCPGPTITVIYGLPADIKVVGDWDGSGSYTVGIVRFEAGALKWYLNNSPGAVPGFAWGQPGDIPIVGDWDNNGTWTPGLVRGNRWFEKGLNSTASHPLDTNFLYGLNGDTPLPGSWQPTTVSQPMTPAVVRLQPDGTLMFHERYWNNAGVANNSVNYGLWRDRPIAGDWTTNSSIPFGSYTYFGPGTVADIAATTCNGLQQNQGWYLRYCNCSGGYDLGFGYDFTRP
jgi:hypothetical protein